MRRLSPLLYQKYISLLGIVVINILSDSSSFGQMHKSFHWLNKIGGESLDLVSGLVVDAQDNLYLTGCFTNNIRTDTYNYNSFGNIDIIIARIGILGNLEKLMTLGGKGNDLITAICSSQNDGLIIAGEISDTIDFGKFKLKNLAKKLFIAKLDTSNNPLWVNTLSSNSEARISSIKTSKTGDIYVCGTYSGYIQIEGDTLESFGETDIFLFSLTDSGSIQNKKSFGSPGKDISYDLCVNNLNNVIMAVSSSQSIRYDSVRISSDSLDSKTNAIILSLDNEFTLKWLKIIYGKEFIEITSIKSDNENNILVSGSFNETLFSSDTVFNSKGHTDCFILKFAENGVNLWGKTFGSWFHDKINDLTINPLGGFFVTGSIGGFTTIDNITLVPESEGISAYVIQFKADGKAFWSDCLSGNGRNFSSFSSTDTKGNLYITGAFRNSIGKNIDLVQSSGGQDIFIAKYYNCKDAKAEIMGDLDICPGFTTQLSVFKEYSNIIWNDSISGKNTLTIGKPGKYWVTMLDQNGCFVSDTVSVTLNLLPVFSLGPDTTLILLDSLKLLTPEEYDIIGWEDGSYDQYRYINSKNDIPGKEQFWLTVSNKTECNYTDTIDITFINPPDWINLKKAELIAYPNPVRETLNWSIKTENPCRLIIELTDINSRVLYHRLINWYSPGNVEQIPMNNIRSGSYNLRIGDTSIKKYYNAIRIVKE